MVEHTEYAELNESGSLVVTPDDPLVQSVREFIKLFIKTIHTLLLYPPSNPLPDQFRGEFFRAARELLKIHSPLLLVTSERGFYFEGQIVWEDEPSDTNPAYVLFRDGVREIGFLPTLTAAESNEFLDVFVKMLARTGESLDISNALWELSIRSVYYRVIDRVADGELTRAPGLADYSRTNHLFFSTVEIDEQEEESTEDNQENNPHGYKGVQQERYRQISEIFDGEVALDKQDAQELVELTTRDAECDGQTEALKILEEIMQGETSQQRVSEIIQVMGYQFDLMIDEDKWAVAPEILKKLFTWTRQGDKNPNLAEAANKGILQAGNRRYLSRMATFLNENPQTDLAPFRSYLEYLDRTALGNVTAMLGELHHHAARKMVYGLLGGRGDEAVDLVGNYVYDKRWYVVRNVALVLGRINRPRAVTFLKKAAKHNDARVRLEALRSLGRLKCPEADAVLMDFIDDPDPGLQIQALKAVAPLPTPEVYTVLEERIQDSRLTLLEPRLQRELLAAYARAGGIRSLTHLMRIINKKKIFRRSRWEQLQINAVYALGDIPSGSITEVLERLRRKGSPALRAAAEQALHSRANNSDRPDGLPEETI